MANIGHFPNCTNAEVSVLADTVDGPITTAVVLVGVIGNTYSTLVLLKTHINSSMVVSLTSLAIWDIALLVTSFVHHSLASNARLLYSDLEQFNSLAASLNGLVVFSYITATWMLIEVTARRFVAVTRPWNSFGSGDKSSIRKRRRRSSNIRSAISMARTPLLIVLFAAIVSIPASFEYRTVPCLRDSKYTFQVEETEILQDPLYRYAFRLLLMTLLKTFGPFIIIAPLTFATLSEYRRSLQRRSIILLEQKLFSLRDSDREKACSLQTISILLLGKFMVLRCWPTLLEIWQPSGLPIWSSVNTGLPTLVVQPTTHLLPRIATLLVLLNSATNSFVFVVLKSAFESRRLRRARERQRLLVARHADQVLLIGKKLVGKQLFNDDDSKRAPSRQICDL